MKKNVWLLYTGFIVLAALMYFGTDVKSNNQKSLEKSRALVKQVKSSQLVMREAYHRLSSNQRSQIDELKVLIDQEKNDESKLNLLKQMSGLWYRWGHYDIAGHYAEKIAEIDDSADSWAIAGTTYAQGILSDLEDRTKLFCAEKSRAAFDQAKLLRPENPEVDLNRALTYVNLPDQSNPMAGIQMLLQVKTTFPKYAPVYRHLGRLANKTGQYDKALERLRTAWQLENDRGKVSCLLAETFKALGATDSTNYYSNICKN